MVNAYKSAVMEQMNEEEQFIHELGILKKVYMRHLINESRRSHNRRILETECYQAYLYLALKYKFIPNKEEILRNIGFELDIENHSLRLRGSRNKVLKNTL